MEQTRKQQIFLSLPFWWIVLTAIYVPAQFLFLGPAEASVKLFTNWLSYFVPIGPIFFVYSGYALDARYSSTLWPVLTVFPFVLLVVFGGEYFLRKMSLSPLKKFGLVILILFLLTVVVYSAGYFALTVVKNGTY